jgi:hypothetical protein
MNYLKEFKKYLHDYYGITLNKLLAKAEVRLNVKRADKIFFRALAEAPELFVAEQMGIREKVQVLIHPFKNDGDNGYDTHECYLLADYDDIVVLDKLAVLTADYVAMLKSAKAFSLWVEQTMAKWRELLTIYNLIYGGEAK